MALRLIGFREGFNQATRHFIHLSLIDNGNFIAKLSPAQTGFPTGSPLCWRGW